MLSLALPPSLLAVVALLSQAAPALGYTPPEASSGDASSSLTASDQWANLLGNAIWFYDAQRSGELPSANSSSRVVPWRNSSCLDDGSDVGLDLAGGFYDAGDYIKATFPLSLVLSSISWGALDYGQAYESSNQTAFLDGVLRWGTDWLIKAHPEPSTLYVQVGNSTLDNNYWGGDLNIPTPRPSFKIDEDSPGTDAAAAAAAAFASSSLLYSGQTLDTSSGNATLSLANDNYSTTLLAHAEDLYAFANSSTRQTYQMDVPAVASAYASSGFGDDLAWAALWLSVASNSSTYFSDASAYYKQYKLSGSSLVFNWDSVVPAIPVLALQIAQSRPWLVGDGASNATFWLKEADKAFDRMLKQEQLDGGLLWFEGDSNSASLNPALNAAMLLFRYAPMASTSERTSQYQALAQQQLDYALGDNPMKAAYVVGQSSNSPKNPHSAMASGGNNIFAIDTDPAEAAYVLYGAVVGGPDKQEKFYDIRSDWPQTEIALDYTAPLLTLAAYSLLQLSSPPPFYTTLSAGAVTPTEGTPCDAVFSCGHVDGKFKPAYIFALAFGLFGLLFVLAMLAAWRWLGWFRARG